MRTYSGFADDGRTARWVKTRPIDDAELIAALRAPRTLRTGAGVLACEASIAGSPLDELAAQRIEELLRERHDRAGDLEFGIPCFQSVEDALVHRAGTTHVDDLWRKGFIDGFHRGRWRKRADGPLAGLSFDPDVLVQVNDRQAKIIADLTNQRAALRAALEPFAKVGRWLGQQSLRWPITRPGVGARMVQTALIHGSEPGPFPGVPNEQDYGRAAEAMGDSA